MRKFILAGICALAMVGCGSGSTGTGKPKGRGPGKSCPALIANSFHEITVLVGRAIPAKIAIELDGVKKIDECIGAANEAPSVVYGRVSGGLGIRVEHFAAYPTLPASMGFRVLDLGNCATAATEFLKVQNLVLTFKTDYPHGKTCGARNFDIQSISLP